MISMASDNKVLTIHFLHHQLLDRVVGTGRGEGEIPPPDFGRSVNPITFRREYYIHHIANHPTGFSDLPTSLLDPSIFKKTTESFFPYLISGRFLKVG